MCGKTRIFYSLLFITVLFITFSLYQITSTSKNIFEINVQSRAEYGLENVTKLPTSAEHGDVKKSGAKKTDQVVIQIDKDIQKLIEDIEAKDSTKWAEVALERTSNFTCAKPPRPTAETAIEDLLCMVR